MYDYLIVGAGLFGAVCAEQLHKQGKKVLVIDRRNHIAGNCYTKNVEGIAVHEYGAHIFHTSNKQVWDYVNQFAEFLPFINSPIAVYHDELYNLPFNMNTFSKLFGVRTPEEAKACIEREKAQSVEEPKNLEEQAISLVGKTVYEKLIKGYTAKQWGKPCTELPAFIIKRLPVRFTYDNNYFNDCYQGIPKEGYTKMVEQMLSGVEVRLGCDFLKEKEQWKNLAKTIIYTGAIDEYFDYRLGYLEYRSVRFESEILEMQNYQGVAVVNYTAEDVPYTRIIEHKHFVKDTTSPKTVVTKEYSSTWKVGEEAYYPVNDQKNGALYQEYSKLAKEEEGVIFGGRLGQYQYYDMDKVIASAFTCLQNMER